MIKKICSVALFTLLLVACHQDPEALHRSIIQGNTEKVQSLLATNNNSVNSKGLGGQTPLMTAAKWGYPKMIQLLISHGADVSVQSDNARTALFYATGKGRLKNMTSLIKQGAKIEHKDIHGDSPLMIAIKKDKILAAKLLLEKGANSNNPNLKGNTPLIQAIDENNLRMATLLIEHKANVNHRNQYGTTALQHSMPKGNLDAIRLLLTHKADPNTSNNQKESPLRTAIQNQNITLARMLLDFGAKINSTQGAWSPLNQAVFDGDFPMIQLLFDRGAKVNFKSNNGWTPLTLAVFRGNHILVHFLLGKNADVNIPNQDGWTPLSLAVLANNLSLTEKIMRHSADTTIVNKEGWGPLSIAIKENNLPMVELLLNLGAKTENKNFGNGLSPIQVALTHKNFLIAQYLIERNPSLIKTNAWNLIETAIKSSNPGLFQFLVDHGINIEQKSEEGLTPLFLATLLDKQEIVRGLARIGADLDPRTSDGMSPLMLAIQKNQLENIKFLLTATPEINRTSADLPPMPRNFFRSRKTSEALKKHYLNLVQEDKKHWTAIMVAIEAGELLDFSKFKSRQAKIHHITPHGITPLMIAAQSGNIDITKELLKAGGNPSNKNHFLPPAMLADLFGHTAIQNLLNHFEARPDTPDINNWKDLIPHRHPTPSNVDVNARNKWGLTPLALALKTDNRNIKIIKLLLNHGANPNASISEENSLGTSLLMIAAHKSSPETIAQLLNHGAKVNAIDKNGNTALTYAIINDKIDNLKLLIKRGAQVKQAHQSGLTPLQLSQKQHPYIIQLLEEAGASN